MLFCMMAILFSIVQISPGKAQAGNQLNIAILLAVKLCSRPDGNAAWASKGHVLISKEVDMKSKGSVHKIETLTIPTLLRS
jgi:hypothetical protein